MKLLIIEDDPSSLKLLKTVFEKYDFNVLSSENGSEAWEIFKKKGPRIVLSDWILPHISGLELCRRIRNYTSEMYTYFILLTAKDKKEDVLQAFSAGADDYIKKPFDINELEARINTGKRICQLEDSHRSLQSNLVNSRNKFRTVFDALEEEIITVDNQLKIVSMNKSALELSKHDVNGHVGRSCCKFIEDGDSTFFSSQIIQMVNETFESGSQQVYMDRFKEKDGNLVIKERKSLPIKDKNGAVHQVTLVSRNITELHRHAAEVEGLNKKLKKVSSELIKKNAKLKSTLENLEKTQAQMLQSEKMASIGQLAAGVAHEINNPTGFVSSNLKTLGDYQVDMQRLIDEYQGLKITLKDADNGSLTPEVKNTIKSIESIEDDVDIDYIKQDVGELISDCREGTDRIKKIVNELKQFAHPGEGRIKDTDINAGLESTLNVVYNELKYKADIIKEYAELPIISAYPQQLNQVFMNILVNAAQAIDKKGEIRITTSHIEDKVVIRISDTGCGISQENLNKIFDPFFTTKDIGKGTGLGMNIAYNIVKKHNGDIRAESTEGKGTTFIISLPVVLVPDEEIAI